MRSRQRTWAGVIQICWMAPEPSISPRTSVSPGATRLDGEIFQPRPSPRAWTAPVPSSAIPPLPFWPVGFSGLIERDLASDKRDRLPRCSPSPENLSAIGPLSLLGRASLDAARLDRFDDAFLKDDEHHNGRQRHDRGGGHDVGPGTVVLLTETRDRDLHHPQVLVRGDRQRPEERVPVGEKEQDGEGREDRAAQRHDDRPPNAEVARAVDQRRLLELARDGEIELAQKEDS